MERIVTPPRSKSPKVSKSNASMGSGNNNNNNSNHSSASKGSTGAAVAATTKNNNTIPRNAAPNAKSKPRHSTKSLAKSPAKSSAKSPAKSPAKEPPPKNPITPEERSRMARDKFRSLLLSADKVQELTQNTNTATPPKTPTAASIGLGLGTGFQPVSSMVSATETTNQTQLASAANAASTVIASMNPPTKAPSTSLNASKSGILSTSPPIVHKEKSSLREATIAAIAKATTSTVKNPNHFPNIDPRTFPKPLGHSANHVMVKPHTTKSMVGVVDRSKNLRQFVEKAIVDHKIFSCVGVYPAIKNALKKRGWVEKTGPINVVRSAGAGGPPRPGDEESDAAWIARSLRDYPPDFIWLIRRDNIDWKNMHRDQMINRFPKAWFTTKVGLAACLQQMHWFSEAGFSETFFPRCYRLCLEDEKLAFQEDYRLTACMSYLRYFVENFERKGANWLVDPQSRITPLSIDFASRQLGNYIRMRRHEDIDWLLPPNFMSQHWDAFVHQYYMVVHEKKKIRFDSTDGVRVKYDMAKKTLQRIAQYWPQANLDGVYNMWICKPGARSRGKGIVIMNSMEKILDLLNHGNSREANWVVQKYMERPLLVYKTKFDIRQWFIITDWTPLTVWFYKESYIRFCTKPFVLEDFHESIHLCNNAIQCRYQNAASRDTALPDENMWDNYTFQAYLKSIGKLDQWPKIYNGMKQAIIGVLLASQESVESRRGCFELYGADFMLSEDFNVWLIEINSCPCMAATTSITARMCAQCLEDCVKVIVDRRHNKNADTGMFEMVYRQPLNAVTVQQFTGHDLVIHGKKLTRDVDWPGTISSRNMSQVRRSSMISGAGSSMKQPSMIVAPPAPAENLTFSDLLQKLRMKNTQMFQGYMNNNQAQTLAAISGPDAADQSVTSVLLSKMRALNKLQQQATADNASEIIPGMKKVYPMSKSSLIRTKTTKEEPEGTLANLSKYFDETSSTFANLVRIGKEIAAEDNSDLTNSRPFSFGSALIRGPLGTGINPYLPRSETAKTLEEVRMAVNAASAKYGKTSPPNNSDDDNNNNNAKDNSDVSIEIDSRVVELDCNLNSASTNLEPSTPSDSGIHCGTETITSSEQESKSYEKFADVSTQKYPSGETEPLKSAELDVSAASTESDLTQVESDVELSSPVPFPTPEIDDLSQNPDTSPSNTSVNNFTLSSRLMSPTTLEQDLSLPTSDDPVLPQPPEKSPA